MFFPEKKLAISRARLVSSGYWRSCDKTLVQPFQFNFDKTGLASPWEYTPGVGSFYSGGRNYGQPMGWRNMQDGSFVARDDRIENGIWRACHTKVESCEIMHLPFTVGFRRSHCHRSTKHTKLADFSTPALITPRSICRREAVSSFERSLNSRWIQEARASWRIRHPTIFRKLISSKKPPPPGIRLWEKVAGCYLKVKIKCQHCMSSWDAPIRCQQSYAQITLPSWQGQARPLIVGLLNSCIAQNP